MAGSTQGTGSERLRAIREALGLTQLQFLPRLNVAAQQLSVREYSQSTLSKLESGAQAISFDDVAVFASVDPERRGKLWLGWGETADSSLAAPRRHGPSVIKEPPEDAYDQPVTPAKKPARKRA